MRYDISIETVEGTPASLERYRGKVLLIVNTASDCGFAPQLTELEQLHQQYGDRGLAVLGFPCNQFAGQEPLEGQAVAEHCRLRFGVTFPLFARVDVKGPNAHPLFVELTQEAPGLLGSRTIKWNFTKFLVNRQGRVIKRFAPQVKPQRIAPHIERALADE